MLSPLQRSCLRWISQGRTLTEVSKLKGRPVAEIELCLKNALAALGVSSIADAMEKADFNQAILPDRSHSKMPKVAHAIDVEVGARIRSRRRVLAMSQSKLGAALGLTFQQVQKYERGTNRVGASRLQNIANILNVPVSYFFDGNAEHVTAAALTSVLDGQELTAFLETREAQDLNVAFAKISSPAVRKRFVVLVKAIADAFPDDASKAN